MKKKTPWSKPELTILVRNRPEEAILRYCKNENDPPGTAPADDDNGSCRQEWRCSSCPSGGQS